MIFKKSGTISTKNIKIAVALILSNLFFFLLFSGNNHEDDESIKELSGWVDVQVRADLLTPFQIRKKVLLLNRSSRQYLEEMLKADSGPEGKLTVSVKEEKARVLFEHEGWEVLPFLKNISFVKPTKGRNHEIHY